MLFTKKKTSIKYPNMSASMIQAWGDGLAFGSAGTPTKFQINPGGQDLQGITFAIEGMLPIKLLIYIFYPNGKKHFIWNISLSAFFMNYY